jgi:hypothetical protein
MVAPAAAGLGAQSEARIPGQNSGQARRIGGASRRRHAMRLLAENRARAVSGHSPEQRLGDVVRQRLSGGRFGQGREQDPVVQLIAQLIRMASCEQNLWHCSAHHSVVAAAEAHEGAQHSGRAACAAERSQHAKSVHIAVAALRAYCDLRYCVYV